MYQRFSTVCFSAIIISFLFPYSHMATSQEIEPVHYAFSNYLGNGIYRTENQSVTLINLPFSYDIGQQDKLSYGLRLPVSVGFFDFDLEDIPDLEFPDQVGTFTFTPGISLAYQMNDKLSLEAYIDVGFARNLTTGNNVSVNSIGFSSIYNFNLNKLDAIWANRIYLASYNGSRKNDEDSYAAIQTGLDIGFPQHYEILSRRFQPRLYATAFWYFNKVEFISAYSSQDQQTVSLQDSYELGVTMKFDQVLGWDWAGIDRLGIGYRYTGGFKAVRLLFSMPI